MASVRKFEMLPHTADLRVRVFGATLEELFHNAFEALMTILGEGARRTGEAKPQAIRLKAETSVNLLIDFLNEVLYLANVEKIIHDRAAFSKFSDTELEAKLTGQTVEGFTEDVKAATYHGADIRTNQQGQLEIEIIFDI